MTLKQFKYIKAIPFAAVWLFMLLFTGCITVFEHPLTRLEDQKPDKRILGTWIAKSEDGTAFIHIGRDKDTGGVLVAMNAFEADGRLDVSTLSGHTSTLSSGTYLNLKWVTPEENRTQGYMLIKYVIDGNRLDLITVEDTVIEKDLEKGRLKGVPDNTKGNYITQDMKSLAAYVVERDAQLFPAENVVLKNLSKFQGF